MTVMKVKILKAIRISISMNDFLKNELLMNTDDEVLKVLVVCLYNVQSLCSIYSYHIVKCPVQLNCITLRGRAREELVSRTSLFK